MDLLLGLASLALAPSLVLPALDLLRAGLKLRLTCFREDCLPCWPTRR